MKRSLSGLVALAIGLGLALVLIWLSNSHLPAARAATLDVCPTCTYSTIQAAVNAAASGDVISITTGTYTENVIITGKVLTFLGAGMGSTIVDGGGLYTADCMTLTNVAVLSNTADCDGGGAWALGAATLSGGLFQTGPFSSPPRVSCWAKRSISFTRGRDPSLRSG